MPISKRDRLARQLDRFGVLRLFENVVFRRGLLVVNYHRIGTSAGNLFDDGAFSAVPEEFDAQVAYLSRRFRLLSLSELLELSRNRFQFPERCALITFDDGYKDNFEFAFPILRKHSASAVFFVATDYVENPRLTWWDHIAYVIKQTQRQTLVLDTNPPVMIDLAKTPREKAILQILRVFKSASMANEAGFLSQLEQAAEVQVDRTALGRTLFMTWSNLNQLVASGMSIGSHTHTHQILAQLLEADQRQELGLSRELLECHLRTPVLSVSYPVGGQDKFTATTKRLCKELGYALGFSFYRGINRQGRTDPLDIKRIGIDITDTPSLCRSRMILTSTFGKTF